MTDKDEIDRVRENLPDDLNKRANELKQRSKNRGLTDPEKQVVVEDVQQMADSLKPLIRKIAHLMPNLARDISDAFEQETDE